MVDARGFSCPKPVMMVEAEYKKNGPSMIEVMVDNKVAAKNVTNYAESVGYAVTEEKVARDFKLTLKK